MDLFTHGQDVAPDAPLADRMRPSRLEEVVGQRELLGRGGFLAAALEADTLPSMILWGPPGSGKTTLARVMAAVTEAHFELFSAVLGGVKEVRAIIAQARQRRAMGGRRTILFVDEIHRFNKAQQDAFLPHVEDGTVTLIGATTENPSFSLNSALLSRCRVAHLEPLGPDDLEVVLERALADEERGLGKLEIELGEGVLGALARSADGDARQALNQLEQIVLHAARAHKALTVELAAELLARPGLRHDRAGDAHYDVASAFIKSLRGSDPDAALYYLARLIEAGDDPRFICRRMVIFASEDVGNADPRALSVAVDCLTAVQQIGLPEGRIIMGQAASYLATAPKSNAAYLGINAALKCVRQSGSLPVPLHIRNAPTKLAKAMGHAEGYRYPHDHQNGAGLGGWVPDHYLPDTLRGQTFYHPLDSGYERHLADRLQTWRGRREDDEKG